MDRGEEEAMKQLAAGLIGALAAGAIVTAWHAHPGEQVAWPVPAVSTTAPSQTAVAMPARLVSSTFGPAALAPAALQEPAAPLSVRCEPGQRAVLRQAPSTSGTATEAACVSDAAYDTASEAPIVYAASPRVVPAAYTVADHEAAPRLAYREGPVRRAQSNRSWKKTALVIGGSTGAGAGIGAIAGGKKGALIGAAIGGGAATLYEAIKRNEKRETRK
jgi:hypothetical protein